jgi:hypothetical protein
MHTNSKLWPFDLFILQTGQVLLTDQIGSEHNCRYGRQFHATILDHSTSPVTVGSMHATSDRQSLSATPLPIATRDDCLLMTARH